MLGKIKQSLFAGCMHKISQNEMQANLRLDNDEEITKAKELLAKHGYFSVENDVVANVQMDNAIREIERYLRNLSESL